MDRTVLDQNPLGINAGFIANIEKGAFQAHSTL